MSYRELLIWFAENESLKKQKLSLSSNDKFICQRWDQVKKIRLDQLRGFPYLLCMRFSIQTLPGYIKLPMVGRKLAWLCTSRYHFEMGNGILSFYSNKGTTCLRQRDARCSMADHFSSSMHNFLSDGSAISGGTLPVSMLSLIWITVCYFWTDIYHLAKNEKQRGCLWQSIKINQFSKLFVKFRGLLLPALETKIKLVLNLNNLKISCLSYREEFTLNSFLTNTIFQRWHRFYKTAVILASAVSL